MKTTMTILASALLGVACAETRRNANKDATPYTNDTTASAYDSNRDASVRFDDTTTFGSRTDTTGLDNNTVANRDTSSPGLLTYDGGSFTGTERADRETWNDDRGGLGDIDRGGTFEEGRGGTLEGKTNGTAMPGRTGTGTTGSTGTTDTARGDTTRSADTTRSGTDSTTRSADNTRVNTRDRADTRTPMDQGNSTQETNITAAIRRAMMNDASLSFTAKNVKIITNGTKVTLRGPVQNVRERNAIGQLAIQTPGVTEVDNQLEVAQ